jgi:hypothetical protein
MNLKEYIDKFKYTKILHLTIYELGFCLVYLFFALIICIYSTPKGSIFSPDSVGYISNAENFLSIFPYYGHSAPIYPALIAIGIGLGLTSEQSASIFPIICYSLLGFPIFLIGKILGRPITGYLSCIICLLCGKYLLWVSTYAWSESPYILFSLLFMLFLLIYNKTGYVSAIAFADLFLILAALTRIIGIVLIPVEMLVIIGNSKGGLKNSLKHIFLYSFIPAAFMTLWLLITNKSYISNIGDSEPFVLANSYKLSLFSNLMQYKTMTEKIYYIDYKPIILIMLLLILVCIIYLWYKQHILLFIQNTLPFTSYIIFYSFLVILLSSKSLINISSLSLEFRFLLPIYPYIILLVSSVLIITYNIIKNKFYKNIFKIVCIFLITYVIAQGVSNLYIQANDIRVQSLSEYPDKLELNEYISEYNITGNDVVYFDWSEGSTSHFSLVLQQRTPNIKKRYIKSTSSKTTILDNLTLPFAGAGPASATSISDLIRENKNHSIYLIAPLKVLQNYIEQPPEDIYFINPVKFTKSFICMVDLKNNETCNTSKSPGYYLIEGNSSIKAALAGNYIGHLKHDQLLISNAKKDTLQIIDFTKASTAKIEYEDKPGAAWLTANHSLLSGDFMGLGYDQILHIAGGKIIIEDFSQGKAPAITRYSEAPARNSALRKLVVAEDTQLAGDFLARGHSQVLFVDRKTRGGILVIADFSKGKAPEMREFSVIGGNSTLLGLMLHAGDKQFSGDFMGLGYGQLMMINCNYYGDKEPKIIIADFGKGKRSASVRYQENWGESPLFSGWLDANNTQLVGDFMGLGHSQILLVNHHGGGGKIMIVDFSQSKPVIKYWENWNDGTLFKGWLDLNDTKVAGNFKGFGYSQVLFLNSSINGLNATIGGFIYGKPMISL